MKPAKLSKFELLAVLRDIVRGVESGDTLEGNFEFLLDYDKGADGWEVRATYRIGNLDGQGGYQMIGLKDDPPVPEAA